MPIYKTNAGDASRFLQLNWPPTARWDYVARVPISAIKGNLDQLYSNASYGRGRLQSLGGIPLDDPVGSVLMIIEDVDPNEVPITRMDFSLILGYFENFVIRIERTEDGYDVIMPEIDALPEDLREEASSLIKSLNKL